MQEHEPEAAGSDARKLDRILSEIATKGDLPAGTEVIQQIQTAIRKEDCNALDVVRIILKDTALSSKVLRVVNSSFYRRAGNPVSTVTGAIVLLGFQTIRDLSAGLLLVDHFSRKGVNQRICNELRRSLYCGLLSQKLSGHVGCAAPEEAYLLGLFANFANLWLAAYYPSEFEEALQLQEHEHLSLERALERVLGGAPGEIAAAALGHWNFPSRYLNYFTSQPATTQEGVLTPSAKLSAVVEISADYITRGTEEGPEGGRQVLQRFQNAFSLEPKVFLDAARAADAEFREHASLNGLPASPVLDARLLTDMYSTEDDTEKVVAEEHTDYDSSDSAGPPNQPGVPRVDDGLCDRGEPASRHNGDHPSATRGAAEVVATALGPDTEAPTGRAEPERNSDDGRRPVPVAASGDPNGQLPASTGARGESVATVPPAKEPRASVPSESALPESESATAPERVAGSSLLSEEADVARGALDPDPGARSPLERNAATALGIIADITRSILDRNKITETLSMVLEGIGRIGHFDVVILALLNLKADRLVGRLGYGEGVQESLGSLSVALQKGAGLLAETVLQRTPQIVPEASAAVLVPRRAPAPSIPGRSFISYPVIVRGKVLGALVAARTDGPTTTADLPVLRLFCDQACLALEKSVS
jgi:HD-like signal output (HDOD) protein